MLSTLAQNHGVLEEAKSVAGLIQSIRKLEDVSVWGHGGWMGWGRGLGRPHGAGGNVSGWESLADHIGAARPRAFVVSPTTPHPVIPIPTPSHYPAR